MRQQLMALWDRLRGKTAREQALHEAEHSERQDTSMLKVDRNATPAAAAKQSAEDVADERAGQPAEEGGEG